MTHALNLKTFTATAALVALAPSAYAATDNRDVVRDVRGQAVVNSFGNCVRTKWAANGDPCGPTEARAPRQVAQRATIAQEDRTVYFGFNQSRLSDESKQKLRSLATTLKSQEDVKEARIIGFADRIGSPSYNEKLSKKRAEEAQRYLVSQGIVNARATEIRWLGESTPATQCADNLPRAQLIACLQKDRRVEVEIDYYPEGGAPVRR